MGQAIERLIEGGLNKHGFSPTYFEGNPLKSVLDPTNAESESLDIHHDD